MTTMTEFKKGALNGEMVSSVGFGEDVEWGRCQRQKKMLPLEEKRTVDCTTK